MSKYKTPVVPYIESRHQGGKQKPTAIILSASFTTSEDGAALGSANAWHSPSSPYDSGHYVVDEEQIYRTADDHVIAGRVKNNEKNALRITLCADPVSAIHFWDLNVHHQVLYKTAKLVADLSLAYKIRVRYLSDYDKHKWEKFRSRHRGGIYLDVAPDWPHEAFLTEVKAQKALKTHF